MILFWLCSIILCLKGINNKMIVWRRRINKYANTIQWYALGIHAFKIRHKAKYAKMRLKSKQWRNYSRLSKKKKQNEHDALNSWNCVFRLVRESVDVTVMRYTLLLCERGWNIDCTCVSGTENKIQCRLISVWDAFFHFLFKAIIFEIWFSAVGRRINYMRTPLSK